MNYKTMTYFDFLQEAEMAVTDLLDELQQFKNEVEQEVKDIANVDFSDYVPRQNALIGAWIRRTLEAHETFNWINVSYVAIYRVHFEIHTKDNVGKFTCSVG